MAPSTELASVLFFLSVHHPTSYPTVLIPQHKLEGRWGGGIVHHNNPDYGRQVFPSGGQQPPPPPPPILIMEGKSFQVVDNPSPTSILIMEGKSFQVVDNTPPPLPSPPQSWLWKASLSKWWTTPPSPPQSWLWKASLSRIYSLSAVKGWDNADDLLLTNELMKMIADLNDRNSTDVIQFPLLLSDSEFP